MRTTLDLDPDVLQAAKEIASVQGTTAGKVISDLARKALEPAAGTAQIRNGGPVDATPARRVAACDAQVRRGPARRVMKTVALLNVNVLVALFQPEHVHHELAHDWFAENRQAGWATCPITETGVVRLLANPRFHAGGIAVGAVVERLRRLQSDSAHEWWEANISLADPNLFQLSAIRGHRQVTDVYLAGLAHSRGAKLVTFDRAVLWSAVAGAKPSLVEVVSEHTE